MTKVHLGSTIAGALLALGASYELHTIIHGLPVDRPFVWAIWAAFGLGMFLMFPGLVGRYAKTVVVFVRELPRFGTRKEDVPIAEAPKGTAPGTPVPTDTVKPDPSWTVPGHSEGSE